jgi:hypothetical protein
MITLRRAFTAPIRSASPPRQFDAFLMHSWRQQGVALEMEIRAAALS